VPSEPPTATGQQADEALPLGWADEAGDPACWAALVCPECGAVLSEGHLAWCTLETLTGSEAARSREPGA
jgi:hypothetical protein